MADFLWIYVPTQKCVSQIFVSLWIYVIMTNLTFWYCWCVCVWVSIHKTFIHIESSFLKLYHFVHILLWALNNLTFLPSLLCCITYSFNILPSWLPMDILWGIYVHSRMRNTFLHCWWLLKYATIPYSMINGILYQILHIIIFKRGHALNFVCHNLATV
jgi:hypothetical protein